MIPEDLALRFAEVTRYLPGKSGAKCRYAIANVVLSCEGAGEFSEEDLWHQIGGWNSRLRGEKNIQGPTELHHGQAAVQKILLAMRRAESDPVIGAHLRRPISLFVRECLRKLDVAVTRILGQQPHLAMTPDERAGMVECPYSDGERKEALFKKPKTKSRVPVADQVTAASSEQATAVLPAPSIEAPAQPDGSLVAKGIGTIRRLLRLK